MSSQVAGLARAIAVMAVAFIPGIAVSAARAEPVPCPSSEIQLVAGASFLTNAPRFDSTYVGPSGTVRAAYDLLSGVIELSRTVGSGETIFIRAVDRFELQGPAPGSIVDAMLILDVDGWVGASGCAGPECSASLSALAFSEFFHERRVADAPADAGRTELREMVTTPVRFTVGQPQVMGCELRIWVGAGGHHEGAATARWSFAGLPAGARIISCATDGDLPVAVHRTSWGRVKILYR